MARFVDLDACKMAARWHRTASPWHGNPSRGSKIIVSRGATMLHSCRKGAARCGRDLSSTSRYLQSATDRRPSLRRLYPSRAIAWVELMRCKQSTIWRKPSSEYGRRVYRPRLERARSCNGCACTHVVWRCYGRGMRAFACGYCCRDHT